MVGVGKSSRQGIAKYRGRLVEVNAMLLAIEYGFGLILSEFHLLTMPEPEVSRFGRYKTMEYPQKHSNESAVTLSRIPLCFIRAMLAGLFPRFYKILGLDHDSGWVHFPCPRLWPFSGRQGTVPVAQ